MRIKCLLRNYCAIRFLPPIRTCQGVAKIVLIICAFTFCVLSFSTNWNRPMQRTDAETSGRIFMGPRRVIGAGYLFPGIPRHYNGLHEKSSHSLSHASSKPDAETAIVNPHPFNYTLLETDVCQTHNESEPEFFLLAVVHTHPANYKRRMAIRETWGGSGGFFTPGIKMVVLFMMGSLSKDSALTLAVREESKRYRDVVQENFEDSYRNLTYKAIMWLKWSSEFCKNANFILKVDDDIFVNAFNLMNHLRHLWQRNVVRKSTILCLVWHKMQVVRNPSSKWYVTKDDYPNDHFSNYCSGSAYILTGDLAGPLYEKSLRTKFFWVDDFYVTGLVPRAIPGGVNYHNLGSLYALKQSEVREKLVHNSALFGHVPGSLPLRYTLWKDILKWHGLENDVQASTEKIF